MTVDELKMVLLEHDPQLKKWIWNGTDPAYTVWEPHHAESLMSDNTAEDRITKVTIHRYTKKDSDKLHEQIFNDLEEKGVPLEEMLTDYEADTGYFHHILECYVSF